MPTQIFDGRAFAKQKESELIRKVHAIARSLRKKPKLVAVGISEQKDVDLYISMKEKVAQRIGVEVERKIFADGVDEKEVLNYVANKNNDKLVDGILLELPIPKKYSVASIMQQISPKKDPDCMTYENLGRVLYGESRLLPATVRAIKDVLFSVIARTEGTKQSVYKRLLRSPAFAGSLAMTSKEQDKPLSYKNAVVIGGGIELGKPLALWLSDLGAAVALCRSTTRDLSQYTRIADVIVSAVGSPNLVSGEMVKEGVVVIDAGINLVDGKSTGDVEFESVSKKASFITPVPGGVGPVTIVSLFENLVELCYY